MYSRTVVFKVVTFCCGYGSGFGSGGDALEFQRRHLLVGEVTVRANAPVVNLDRALRRHLQEIDVDILQIRAKSGSKNVLVNRAVICHGKSFLPGISWSTCIESLTYFELFVKPIRHLGLYYGKN